MAQGLSAGEACPGVRGQGSVLQQAAAEHLSAVSALGLEGDGLRQRTRPLKAVVPKASWRKVGSVWKRRNMEDDGDLLPGQSTVDSGAPRRGT